jgi:L-alanine-DL-glutamate epimerase-like enolase superfamily enzyme
MAIYDILAKSANMPLCEYLGGKRETLCTNLTISLGSIEDMLKDALAAYNNGFSILKVKVGEDEDDTVEVTRQIRERLPNVIIRLDANQAWDAAKSLRIIEKVEKYKIELLEQPVKASDFAGLKEVTAHSPVPILADESVFDYEDAVRILDGRMADYINIKLMKTGGIYEAIKIAALAKERGAKVMMGSMLESVVSISAAVHFAMSDDNICFYDLDGPLLAKPSSVKNALIFEKDEITVSECIGLGVKL